VLLQTVARVIVTDARGTLAEQIGRRGSAEIALARFKPVRSDSWPAPAADHPPRTDLLFYNGLGGFTPDGREYVTTTTRHRKTPAPLVQRPGESFLRQRNFGKRQRIHLERECARDATHALAQRSNHGCKRRSALSARRRKRLFLVTNAPARAWRRALHHSARFRL